MNIELLKKLSLTHSVTSDTNDLSAIIQQELLKLNINFYVDGYGSIIANHNEGNRLLIAAHIDEVGFQLTNINEDGTFDLLPVGWVFPNRIDHAHIYVNTLNGIQEGAIFHKDELKSENIGDFSKLKGFLGYDSKDEAISNGLRIGQLGSFKKYFWEQGQYIFSSGLDNALSIFAILNNLSNYPEVFKSTTIIFHNDEEMRDHSANSVALNIKTEYAMILDYCPVHQATHPEDIIPKNQGPFIIYRGGGHIIHEDLRKYFDKMEIPKAFVSGSTLPGLEPDNFQNNGKTKAFNFCIPAFGYHGAVYAVNKKHLSKYFEDINSIVQILS